MVIYYIDDSFFENTDYARQMLYKLEVLIKEQMVSKILVSSNKEENEKLVRYKERFEKFGLEFIISTKCVDLNGEKILLTNNSLNLANEVLRCYAGTICVIDEVSLEWKRIYLDLFPQEETDIITLLQEAIEQTMGIDTNSKLKS